MKSMPILEQATGEILKKVLEANNENIETRDQDLASIKEWLRKQPHLPDEWEDTCLLAFLRGSNFSLEKCKKKLDMYFTMRTACPEFFSKRNITQPELTYVINKGQAVILAGLTPEGRRVTIYRLFDKTTDINRFCDAIKVSMMLGDIRLREEIVGFSGDVYIIDTSFITIGLMARVPLTLVKKYFICVMQAYPDKIKEIHIINPSPVMDTIFNFTKPFVKAKIFERVKIHSDISGLLDHIPKDMLPVDFGGNAESMETLQKPWVQKLHDYIPWFEAQEQLKADESLRPGKPTNYDELFGIEGSFRQLKVD